MAVMFFKALALGADGVLIARPFVTAVYGGAEEGVAELVNRIGGQLRIPWPCAVPTALLKSPGIWCGSFNSNTVFLVRTFARFWKENRVHHN